MPSAPTHPRFAECMLAATIPGRTTFTYEVPEALAGRVAIGSIVLVPLRSRKVKALVVGLGHETAAVRPGVKAIAAVRGTLPDTTLKLIRFIADESLSSVAKVLRAALPDLLVHESTSSPINPAKSTGRGKYSQALLYGPSSLAPTLAQVAKQGQRLIVTESKERAHAVARLLNSTRAIYHAGLGKKAKARVWDEAAGGQEDIYIGTRNLLYLPFSQITQIIVIAAEDTGYYSEMAPYISYVTIARKLAELAGASLTIHSFAPALEMAQIFTSGETRSFPRPVPFSVMPAGPTPLPRSLLTELDLAGRTLFFCHRRGLTNALICPVCGLVERCPNCGIALTVHRERGEQILVCHHCNYRSVLAITCPRCDSPRREFVGFGTQQIEEKLGHLFGADNVARVDRDSKASRTDRPLTVATRMIFYLEDPGSYDTIVMPDADLALLQPDFRAAERLFGEIEQLKTMLKTDGKLIFVATYPDEPLFAQVAGSEFRAFAVAELPRRQQLHYPPFYRLIKIGVSGETRSVRAQLAGAKQRLQAVGSDIEVLGPTPALVPMQRGQNVEFITLKVRAITPKLAQELTTLPAPLKVQVDPISL